ncbi:hypothetical protein MAR_013584 [Mya arenaria]|uniref:Uncharacterized protein n=1 Tax=Mya arenaria TaxID=6604 RepID=A0ABY7G088_MYAAR|nr:uncharacterized protein LOC128220373 [Mya arenaria]WAR27880.1 hypothetical protein MAR_013584 [Mya arenaria]
MATRRSERRVTRSTSTKTEADTVSEMKNELQQTEVRFRKACNQINLLNRKMESIHKRYNCAKKNNHRVFRYKLRLRLAVVEGLRNMYYEYANKKASRVVELRSELYNESVEVVQQEDSEFEDSEMEDGTE